MDFSFKKSSGFSLPQAISLEWLETNGLGGYASSSGINCHTRKYHGLLVSKLEGLPDRYVLLSKLEDIFFCNSDPYYLTAHDYPNFLQDGSFANLEEFSVTTHPYFNYQFEDIEVSKEILMPFNTNTILIKYSIKGAPVACKVTIRPLVAVRNFHTLCRENSDIETKTVDCKQGISFTPYRGMPTLFFQANTKFNFLSEPLWYRNFTYPKEKERGYEFQEDLFTPGIFTFELSANLPVQEIYFSCSLNENKQELTQIWQQEIERRDNLEATFTGTLLQKALQKTAQSFIVTTPSQHPSIVAGYHWFLEWGRDAMISLPSSDRYSGKEDLCLEILKEFSKHEMQGVLPNMLGLTPEQNSYNSVDTSLWFAWAVQQYYIKTKNIKAIAQYLWPTLKNIYLNYKNGTLHNIKMLSNGLLYAGNKDINITWMDAKIDGVPVTSRHGLQVEVNALWYNMLCFMVYLANNMLDSVKHPLESEISLLRKAFRETFW
ncbi:MAG: glycogen debranching enzyme N-terminal domain-containing protein, partial [Gammaproteobacteria bacterium]|nr:glycogen debranching enzyme N-terminal domain-containing protein [Gammaproteobacteria bacterium]